MTNQARERIVNQVRQLILKAKIVVIRMTQIKKVHKVQMMGKIVTHRVEEVRVEVEEVEVMEVGGIINRKEENLKEKEKVEMGRVKVNWKSFK